MKKIVKKLGSFFGFALVFLGILIPDLATGVTVGACGGLVIAFYILSSNY